MKRQLSSPNGADPETTHPSRKRRIEYTQDDAKLAQVYDQLTDDIQSVRLKAASDLLKTLSTNSLNRVQRIETALTRLIKGLASGRKAARLGFSIALAEVLRLSFKLAYTDDISAFKLSNVTYDVVRHTQPEGKANGQEKRNHFLGRWFAFQAILQSNIATNSHVAEKEWRVFMDAVLDLMSQSQWMRAECGLMLFECIIQKEIVLSPSRIQAVIDSLNEKCLLKTAEGVALWLAISEHYPQAQMPKGVWHKGNPMSLQERQTLKRILQGGAAECDATSVNAKADRSGARQVQPSFAWRVILTHLCQRNGGLDFKHFWDDVVEQSLFSPSCSAERKALGVQIVRVMIAIAPSDLLLEVLTKRIVGYVISQRVDNSRYLNEAVKACLEDIVARAQSEPQAAHLFTQALLTNGALNFDQLSKTKTIESLIQVANDLGLQQLVLSLRGLIVQTGIEDQKQVENQRRILADLLLAILRCRRDLLHLQESTPLPPWLDELLSILVSLAYLEEDDGYNSPRVSQTSRSNFQSRLTSCLGLLSDHQPQRAILPLNHVLDRLRKAQKHLHKPLGDRAVQALESAESTRKDIVVKVLSGSSATKSSLRAYQLLLSLSMLQIYNHEPDSVDIVNDLIAGWQAPSQGNESVIMLVELLLSFTSKQSAFSRKLAEQVFGAFAADIPAEGLQSMVDILGQNEDVSGQQQLFDQHDEDGSDDEDEDDGAIDVDDASDLGLVNGEESRYDEDIDTDDEDKISVEAEDVSDDADEDEEAAFSRKLADALGTTGMDADDSDDDGSDMDDEQMLALEPHLASIFKEHKKKSSAKREQKDAKQNIVNFKNRVLDLLMIYVKSQYANSLALDLILPLDRLIRTTKSKPTAEKAFTVLKQYFEMCNKHKCFPRPEDAESCFTVLAAVHAELKQDSSKLHATACSRSGLFCSKVLVSMDRRNYVRIAQMYAELQGEWYLDASSKVQGSVFTEWNSWSLATRKSK